MDLFLDAPVAPTPDVVLDVEADAHVRSGAYATTNFGTEATLVVKSDAAADFDREALLRFDLAPLAGTTASRVELVLAGAARGDLARTTPYRVHGVADDAWDETAVTWATRPALGTVVGAHFARDDVRVDVTEVALAELVGDGVLSLGLSAGLEGAQRAFHLRSREASDAGRRPRLEVFFAP